MKIEEWHFHGPDSLDQNLEGKVFQVLNFLCLGGDDARKARKEHNLSDRPILGSAEASDEPNHQFTGRTGPKQAANKPKMKIPPAAPAELSSFEAGCTLIFKLIDRRFA